MEEKVLLTLEELQKLKSIQDELNQIALELGSIEIQFINLSGLKSQAHEKFNKIKQIQDQLGIELNTKYGTGSINLDNGEFIKSN